MDLVEQLLLVLRYNLDGKLGFEFLDEFDTLVWLVLLELVGVYSE